MKIVAITFRNPDLTRIQRAAWEKFVPGVEFLVAANEDHRLDFLPDFALKYSPGRTLWPQNLFDGVQQVLAAFDDDLIIAECDIFPVAPLDLEELFNPGSIRIWRRPYPGLLFMPRSRLPFEKLRGLGWEWLTEKNNPLPFEVSKDMKFELIDGKFLHWNHGNIGYRNNPQMDPRKDIIGEFNHLLGVQ